MEKEWTLWCSSGEYIRSRGVLVRGHMGKRSQDTSGISIEPCSFQEDLGEVMMDGSKYNSDVL